MVIKLEPYNVVLEKSRTKNLLFFGAGRYACWQCDACPGIEKLIKAVIDNDSRKVGTYLEVRKSHLPVISLQEAVERYGENVILILTLKEYKGVIEQLKYVEEYKNVECYVSKEWREYNEEVEVHGITHKIVRSGKAQIPKVINYFWVGGNKIPESNQRCIDSWKKFCPDYEIKEWNENNYDLTKNLYMKQAYEKGRWGFVPDFARLDIIYNNGGIYLDTDVEIIKNIDDLLYSEAFIGWESRYYVNAGSGFGAAPHNAIIREMMQAYEGVEFVNSDGSLNLIASPRYQTEVLERHGLIKNGRYQKINGMDIYPANFFSPKSFYSGINWANDTSYMIHHYDATWVKGSTHDGAIKQHKKFDSMKRGIEIKANEDNMSDLVSVIIPVYNVEKYFDQCMESVLAQTYKSIEIILVDDGSQDSSGEMCDEYKKKYDNVVVIHKKNGGLASARKAGVEAAKGSYVVCVDSDDWIDEEMISYLHHRIINSQCDIAVSNMVLEFEITGKSKKMVSSLKPGVYDLNDEDNLLYRQFLVDDAGVGILHGICGKMIKTSLYRQNQMNVPDVVSVGEDAACMYPCYMQAERVYITEGIFYHYRQREESILHGVSKNILNNWETLFNFLQEKCKFDNSEIQKIVYENLEKFIYRRIMINVNKRFENVIERRAAAPAAGTGRVFGFPFRCVKKNSRIVLYGAGKVGTSYYMQIQNACYCYLKGIYDTSPNGNLGNFVVQGPEQLQRESFDYVVVAVLSEKMAKSIIRMLKDNGIPKEKIIWEKPTAFYVDR